MSNEKLLISILMAVYEPKMDWLEEQLKSLNSQSYPNLRLYIRDDCSPTVAFEDIEALVKACITNIPYTIARNEKNLGSNGTFERLTSEAAGDLFAYCDQDDVWLPEKLDVLERQLTESGALLVCSDMYIIDGEGERTADSITKVRRHHEFRSGNGLAEGLLFHNFVTGCTMLVQAELAKAAIPFCPYMVHDHYIALWCAAHGGILSLDDKLIEYRLHGDNQTGLLAGVHDKRSYQTVRIDMMAHRLEWLEKSFPSEGRLKETIDKAIVWAHARQENWNCGKEKWVVWKNRQFSRLPSAFELIAESMPEWIFKWFLWLGKNNRV